MRFIDLSVFLITSCKANHTVATAALDMTSWQCTIEARLDSVVNNGLWTFDNLVVMSTPSDSTAPVKRLTAKKATLATSQKRISSEVVETQRTDSVNAQASHEEVSAPVVPSNNWWLAIAVAIIIIALLKKIRFLS